MNNYSDVINWMYSQLPFYQRKGSKAYKPNLGRMIDFANYLGNPQNKVKTIHVGGTNGKGSTSHMIASVLQDANYKVGLYTSPHIKSFRERIKINGNKIGKKYIVEFIKSNLKYINNNKLSFFEISVGIAFNFFHLSKVDIAIIEVGMGGRLDATNVIEKPLMSIITNISLEHTKFLGKNREKIAIEKAGIVKKNSILVVGQFDDEISEVFKFISEDKKTKLLVLDRSVKQIFKSDLIGNYQIQNLRLSYLALKNITCFKISKENMKKGFENVRRNTGLRLRWEEQSQKPKVIFDISHNKAGFEFAVKQLSDYKFKRLRMVLGFVKDKNIEEIVDCLPNDAEYYLCKPNVERGFDLKKLKNIFDKFKLSNTTFKDVKLAYDFAKKNSNYDDLIYVGGSTFIFEKLI